MRISPIAFVNNQKNYKIYQKPIHSQRDVFVKSQNEISFTSKRFAERYIPLSNEMTDYIMKSEDITIEGIDRVFKKYCPDTTFDDIENLQTNRQLQEWNTAYTKIPIFFSVNENTCKVTVEQATLYAKMPQKSGKRERMILLDSLLHEASHLLQEGSKDRKTSVIFFNEYFKKCSNPISALEDVEKLPILFSDVEENMFDVILSSGLEFDSLPKQIAKNITLDSICKKEFQKTTHESFMYLIMAHLNMSGMDDPILSLDYIILKANNEKEAYTNALKSDKRLLALKGRTDFDLRIEAYEALIKSAEDLKSRFKKLGLK